MEKNIHIISFNVPFPPDYGGVIDIFYKIKFLSESGYNIHLHTFLYNREPAIGLNHLCSSVNYYMRQTGTKSFFSPLPYTVNSRRSRELLVNLLKDDYPILFEGLHSCFFLDHPAIKKRRKIVRLHNIEHNYYRGLAYASRNVLKKLFFFSESIKLKGFESLLSKADWIIPISFLETSYYKNMFGERVTWVSAFHDNSEPGSQPGKGDYILVHGNFRVEENEMAAIYIINYVLGSISFPVVFAGHDPSPALKRAVSKIHNARVIESPSDQEMKSLISNAHINLLVTFQNTGIKLKLINALFMGRFVITNTEMVEGTGLEDFVKTGTNTQELIKLIKECINLEFTPGMKIRRIEGLKHYTNEHNLQTLLNIINQ